MEYISNNSSEFKGIIRSYVEFNVPKLNIITYGRESEKQTHDNLLNFSEKNGEQSPHLCLYGIGNTLPYVDFNFPYTKIFLTKYTIRSHVSTDYYLTNWTLLGSNNKNQWRILHKRENQEDLFNGLAQTYEISNENREFGFSTFRIKMNSNNTSDNGLRILNIDFYGYVYTKQTLITCEINNLHKNQN